MTFETPPLTISEFGVSISSPEIAEKLAKKKISPSLISSLNKCPAQWVSEAFVLRELIQEPDNAGSRGSLFHKVAEEFFTEAPELRTRERLEFHKKQVLETEEFSFFKEIPDALEWLDKAFDNYYAMGGRPELVKIASIPSGETEKLALEVFVKGNLAGASRDTLGFIDRLTVDRNDPDAVIIEDWKSGAKAKTWNPKTKSEDGLAEARQQVIYSLLLRKMGIKVTGARLIYPVAKEIVNVDLADEEFEARVLNDIKEADEALATYTKTNLFEFRPQFLCSWCPLSKICPKAQVTNNAKAVAARRSQPPIEVLSEGFDFA